MQLDQQTWDAIFECAKKCQRTWGMGFPVISMPLLRDILEGRKPDEPPKYPSEYLPRGDSGA